MTSTLHIVVAMKPLDGNFASNAIKHGVAGLNIDGCRIGVADADIRSGGFGLGKRPWQTGNVGGNTVKVGSEQGRFPSNVILAHKEGCRQVGVEKVKGQGHWTNVSEVGNNGVYGKFNALPVDRGNIVADEDGKETVEQWECAPGCPVKEFPQGGASGKASGPAKGKIGSRGRFGVFNGDMGESCFYNDTGSAARFFKQVKEV